MIPPSALPFRFAMDSGTPFSWAHIYKTERDGRNDEEIHRSNATSVVSEKRHPTLLLAPITGVLGHIPRHGCEADSEAELPELPKNLPSAPIVLQRETHDQFLGFCG
jgi:hypothetical protein